MSLDNDETDRVLEEEHPGPNDLESALVSITLSDVVEHTPLVVEANTSLASVIEAMQRDDRGTVLVVDAGKLVGIFTERDVLMKVAGLPIDLTQSKVSAFMTPDPVTLPADPAVAFALNRMVLGEVAKISSGGRSKIPWASEPGSECDRRAAKQPRPRDRRVAGAAWASPDRARQDEGRAARR